MSIKKLAQRDLVGTQIVDYDEIVDVKRLRKERLDRLQEQCAIYDLGGMLMVDPVNVRYATGVRGSEIVSLRLRLGAQAIVPQQGKPILLGGKGLTPAEIEGLVDSRELLNIDFWETGPFYKEACKIYAQNIKDSMIALGISGQRLGVDLADTAMFQALLEAGIDLEDSHEAIAMARAIKTSDEIALIRQACAIADVALWEVQQAIRPGITENELFAVMSYTNLKHHGERMDCKLLAAGGNTNPWLQRTSTSRMVRPGDLVTMDTDMAGPLGYFADVSRTYLCGDGPPNTEQMEAYKLAYDFLYKSIPLFTVGTSFQEIAEKVPAVPQIYKANRYAVIAHGVGMSDEWPAIFFADTSGTGFGNIPGTLEENMVMTMEASFGREDGREQVKLEEQLLITANGPEIMSTAPFDWRFVP
jgi:Xaa-Pro aminopeptidase